MVAPDAGLTAVVWTDDEAEGWADAVAEVARSPEIGRVLLGGRARQTVLATLPPEAARKTEAAAAPSFSRLVAEAMEATPAGRPGDVLVMVAPYRLDPASFRRGRDWLRSDRRLAAVIGWEIGDDPRALVATPPKASQSQLAAMSRRLDRRLGAIRPVPVAAVHQGVALLSRSGIEVLGGLDPALDARPGLSLMEFSIRCQRRGFVSVIDPVAVCRPLRAQPAPGRTSQARAELAERFRFMPQHFESESASEHTPFGITRLLARRALTGLSLLVHHRPGHRLSPLLTHLMQQAATDPHGGNVVLVADGALPFDEIARVPVSPRITVTRGFDAVAAPADLLFVSLDADVPPAVARLAKRVVLELHPNQPEDLMGLEARQGRPPDALLVDCARTLRWLRETSRATPLDRAHILSGGVGVVAGAALSRPAQTPFGPDAATAQFALCIAPHFDGKAVDDARRRLAASGRTLPLLVIDSLDGPERSGGQLGPPMAPVLVLANLSAGERAWCRAHATVVYDDAATERARVDDQTAAGFTDLCFDILSRQPRSP